MSFPSYYVICVICKEICKETEISQKRSKGIKHWKITYSLILSVLSNKANLISGFSSLLNKKLSFDIDLYRAFIFFKKKCLTGIKRRSEFEYTELHNRVFENPLCKSLMYVWFFISEK